MLYGGGLGLVPPPLIIRHDVCLLVAVLLQIQQLVSIIFSINELIYKYLRKFWVKKKIQLIIYIWYLSIFGTKVTGIPLRAVMRVPLCTLAEVPLCAVV